MNGFTRPIIGLTIVCTSFFLTACGSSSSGPATADTQGTGQVVVLITDGPTDQYERVLITLTRMLLIGAGGQQVIYDGDPITFDLLKLRDRTDFAFSQRITEGNYSKIRLEISEIRLIDLGDLADPNDDVEEILDDLPANGKIDLNPQGPFTVTAGKTTVISLDIDARRSFQVVQTGNQRLKFRPVIFVDIFQDDIALPNRLIRAFGRVESIDEGAESLLLCDLQFVAALGAPAAANNTCARVFVGSAHHFGADGLAIDFAALADAIAASETPQLTVIGLPSLPGDGAPDNVILDLDSVVTQLGGRKTDVGPGWETTDGLIQGAPTPTDCDTAQCTEFLPNDTDTPITIQLQAETRVFGRDGTELGQADMVAGTLGGFDGLRVPAGGAEALRASLFIVGATPGGDLVSGTLTAVSVGNDFDILTLQPESGDPVAVCITAETDVLRILVDGESVSIADLLDPAVLDVSTDLQIDAAGEASATSGCDIDATVVIIE